MRLEIMGLLTKQIDVILSSRNIKHYEDLGYIIPRYYNKNSCTWRVKRKTIITVDIKDVPLYSSKKVQVKCDYCEKIQDMEYQRYTDYNRDRLYFCCKCAIKLFNTGENNSSWNSEISDEERITKRHFDGYKDFTKRVLIRDNYTCKCCGNRGNKLEVHHLDGYNWYKDGRTDETNSVTLCKNCHTNFHSIYGKGNNTKSQFEEWIGKSIELLNTFEGELPRGKQLICYENKIIYDCPPDFQRKTGIIAQRVIDCCNRKDFVDLNNKRHRSITVNSKHYFWLEDYNKMTPHDFDEYFKWCEPIKVNNSGKNNYLSKKVICLNTLKVFDCVSDASKEYAQAAVTNITRCCEGKRNKAGIDSKTKMPLVWMYYNDYVISSDEEIKRKMDIKIGKGVHIPIICLNTKEIFSSFQKAADKYELRTKKSIKKCCEGITDGYGYTKDGDKLKWMYYNKYLESIA